MRSNGVITGPYQPETLREGCSSKSLKREYPEIAQEIEPLLQQNGKPLKSWHVQRVLDKVDAMQAAKVKDASYHTRP